MVVIIMKAAVHHPHCDAQWWQHHTVEVVLSSINAFDSDYNISLCCHLLLKHL